MHKALKSHLAPELSRTASLQQSHGLLRRELLKHLLPSQLVGLVLELVERWLLVNEDFIGQLKVLILEDAGRKNELVALE